MPWTTLTKDFDDYCWITALGVDGADRQRLAATSSADVQMLVSRSPVEPITTINTPIFGRVSAPALEGLAQSSIADRAVAEGSVLVIPFTGLQVNFSLVGIAGGGVAEGAPKPIRSASFAGVTPTVLKADSRVVVSAETLRGAGAAEMIGNELRRGVAQAMNAVFLNALAVVADTIAASGSTAAQILADLTTAITTLGVHGRSKFYAAVDPSTYAELALKPSSATVGPIAFPDFPVIGGVTFMPSDSLTNTAIIFDAGRLAFGDGGLRVDQARHASIELDDAPGGSTAATSLWQRNLVGIRAERMFSIAFATPDTSGSLPAVKITGAW